MITKYQTDKEWNRLMEILQCSPGLSHKEKILIELEVERREQEIDNGEHETDLRLV